jgi:uncharacterized protein
MIESMIFFPDRRMPGPPPGVSERWFRTADGLRIHAWFAAGPPDAPTLVWSHGNAGNIADRGDVLLELQESGLAVLAYDYRGYGRSEGRPSEAGVYLDAEAAYDDARSTAPSGARIVCFGESLGGAVSVYLATRRPCAGLAVVSTFTSLADAGRSHYGPFARLASGRFDSRSRIGALRAPFFAAHGDLDEVVPFHLGESLFAAAPEPKRFFRAAGRRHNDVFGAPGLVAAIAAFARELPRS